MKVCFLSKNWLLIHITILYISLIEILLLFDLEFAFLNSVKGLSIVNKIQLKGSTILSFHKQGVA